MRHFSLAFLVFVPTVFAAVSPNGKCGGTAKYNCIGSDYGDCCSQYGYCGSRNAYCGDGCQNAFGSCNGVASSRRSSSTVASSRGSSSTVVSSPSLSSTRVSSFQTSTRTSSAAPSSTQPVSTNARCGPGFGGQTCQGSRWGNCCSQHSYCGSTNDYCAADTCQKGYGYCNGAAASSARSSSSSRISSTSRTSSSTATSRRSSTSSRRTSTSSSTMSSSSSSSSIVVSTPSNTPTPTPTPSSTTPAGPAPTLCDAAQTTFCSNTDGGCNCSLALDHSTAYCWDSGECQGCASDSDCPAGSRCAYDQDNICGDAGGTYCVDNDAACGGATPPPYSSSAKRDLERVFMNAGREFKRV